MPFIRTQHVLLRLQFRSEHPSIRYPRSVMDWKFRIPFSPASDLQGQSHLVTNYLYWVKRGKASRPSVLLGRSLPLPGLPNIASVCNWIFATCSFPGALSESEGPAASSRRAQPNCWRAGVQFHLWNPNPLRMDNPPPASIFGSLSNASLHHRGR